MLAGLTEMSEDEVLRQSLHLRIGQHDELLVGGGVYEELITFLLEDALHLHSHLNGVLGQLEVEVVRKQGIKLQTYQRALSNDGAVLLLDGEEVFVSLAVGEDHRLATQGTNLRSANVETSHSSAIKP